MAYKARFTKMMTKKIHQTPICDAGPPVMLMGSLTDLTHPLPVFATEEIVLSLICPGGFYIIKNKSFTLV